MADTLFAALTANSTLGVFSITLHYDNVSLLITSADVVNSTGDVQHVTVGTHSFDVPDGTNTSVALSSFNQFMVNTSRGPRPPVFIG